MSRKMPTTVANYHKMRDEVDNLFDEGISVPEIFQIMQEKFGNSAPAISTIYYWKGGFQERKREQEEMILDEGQKSAKIPDILSAKYCVECNRDFCNRQYYELHMLKYHDILLGDSKNVIEYLEKLEPSLTQNIIFRCDACFDGALDFDRIEELQQHKLHEHDQQMRMPERSSIATKSKVKTAPSKSKMPFKIVKSSKVPPISSANPPSAAAIPKYNNNKKVIIRRDQSLPASSLFRRSKRLAKDVNEKRGPSESGFEDEERKRMRRSMNFLEETAKEIGSTNEGAKLDENNEEMPALNAEEQQQEENINGEEVNGIVGLLSAEEKMEEEFVINENPSVELAEEMDQTQIQKQQENSPANDKSTECTPPPTKRQRMASPRALDAANSLLQLTFGSALNLMDSADEFSDLSNAELTELEKAERKTIETRIQALKNIQWHFDQAALQFQQYLATLPSSSTITNGTISGIKESSSSLNLGPSTSSSTLSMQIPTAIQNGVGTSSSSMATTKNNKQ